MCKYFSFNYIDNLENPLKKLVFIIQLIALGMTLNYIKKR